MLSVFRRVAELLPLRHSEPVAGGFTPLQPPSLPLAGRAVDARLGYGRAPQQPVEAFEEEIEFTISPLKRLWDITGKNVSYASVQATAVSVALHAFALLLVAEITFPRSTSNALMELQAFLTVQEEEVVPPEPNLTLAPIAEEPHENQLASLAESAAAVQSDTADLKPEALLENLVEIADHKVPMPLDQPIEGFKLDTVKARPGTVGEELVHVEGAVDRITHEIIERLDEGPLLVIWLMDQSISLKDTREEVADRMEKVFSEIGNAGQGRDAALLNAVVGFGQKINELQLPTGEIAKIAKAVRNVPIDESGIENVFSAVGYSVDRFRPLMAAEKRKAMIVIWTDESGDDHLQLEQAIQTCRRFAVPVFTVGPSSMFGRQLGTHAYTHPDDGQVYQIPVFRGPETPFQERLKLPYWFEGDQLETIRSGIGPYALTRLAVATGGSYFINDSKADRSPYRLESMRPYLPNYTSAVEQKAEIDASPLRKAIMRAVEVSHGLAIKPTPQLEFAPTGNTFQEEMRDAQKTVAYNMVGLTSILEPFGTKGFEAEYEKEKSPRWRAWYDLTYGRILAMTVRNQEYNWACAEMKGKGAEFVNKQSNRWKFVPSTQIKVGSSTQRMADEAKRLLTRCVENNPGTPWEALALRELRNPSGFKVEEAYVAPPPPPEMRPAPPNPNPPPPPNNRLTTEKPKMIERIKPVDLPKL